MRGKWKKKHDQWKWIQETWWIKKGNMIKEDKERKHDQGRLIKETWSVKMNTGNMNQGR